MQTDIKIVKPLEDFGRQVELSDGRRGVFDLTPYLPQPALAALRHHDRRCRQQFLRVRA
jgi:hypothetical protein